ncbi:MAG: transposase, partial [Bacteroidales bacterium]
NIYIVKLLMFGSAQINLALRSLNRSFSTEEKLRILQEVSVQGVNVTLEKYGIYPSTYYSWRNKLAQMGEDGLKQGMTKEHLKQTHQLEKENEILNTLLV